MTDFKSVEKTKLEKMFGMNSGHILDFFNRNFGQKQLREGLKKIIKDN